MENKIEFAKGIYFNKKREQAPDFVLGSIAIMRDEFILWLQSKEDNKIYLEVLESKTDKKPYIKVSDYKPKEAPKMTEEQVDEMIQEEPPF